MSFYNNKNVLVTGGTGLIGQPLVNMLLQQGAKVTVVSLDDPSRAPQGVSFKRADLREFSNCLEICKDQEIVFQLAGVKGSPAMTAKRPASFFVPTITFSINMMEAARRVGVERYLFTSSVGVYSPAEVFYEDDVWKTFPSPNDRFAGWAKRMGELQAEAYKIEYNWDKISIVRPANVYGPYDNFDPQNAMVIPSLIKRAMDGESPLTVWGDGSPIRDFIHAKDVARGMMLTVEKGINEPINLGSGTGVTIKQIAEIVAANVPNSSVELAWDVTKPAGDAKRLMDMTRANSYGFVPEVSIEAGIKETIAWYANNHAHINDRYNAFTEEIEEVH
ncbi:MAG TPA: NAD-dependent epimerase/dehydratase family protein [Gammaproteobacteria bacterium]|jgi:GDP-L-fucose synthase|nr:NAD-dependent epimerase/dehydratase family protein [Gammaproteobacteria bacterium]